MNVLLDTNILARMAQPGLPMHVVATNACVKLQLRGDIPCLVPQVLYELWSVATRPAAANGLGLTSAEAEAELTRLKGLFPFLPDTAAIYPEWERLVTVHQVVGKNSHDARLVAAMSVHGISHMLTFNAGDFTRYPNVTAIDPASVSP